MDGNRLRRIDGEEAIEVEQLALVHRPRGEAIIARIGVNRANARIAKLTHRARCERDSGVVGVEKLRRPPLKSRPCRRRERNLLVASTQTVFGSHRAPSRIEPRAARRVAARRER